MLGKILFNKLTPYNRSYIHITLKDEKVITLPAINSAVFFLTNGDKLTINNLNFADNLPFIDYQLIEADKRFNEEMQSFKTRIKDVLYKNNFMDMEVIHKQIINNDVYIVLLEIEIQRENQ